MKPIPRLMAACLVACGVLAAAPARAGTLDHLLCYRIKDPVTLKTKLDMIAELQPEFSQRGCQIRKAVEFCVPATKTNVNPPPPFAGLMGQPLQDDYLCYVAKCPKQPTPPPPAKLLTDQFGARTVKKWKVFKVCVPARKEPAPCDVTAPHQCGGTCPNPSQQCAPDPADAGCKCLPIDLPGCAVDATGKCSGICPTNPAIACQYDAAGNCGCAGQDCGASAPACNGTCPSPLLCNPIVGTNQCQCG